MITDEYMKQLELAIDRKMQAYELYRRPIDRIMLEAMVASYEAKQKQKLRDEQV